MYKLFYYSYVEVRKIMLIETAALVSSQCNILPLCLPVNHMTGTKNCIVKNIPKQNDQRKCY